MTHATRLEKPHSTAHTRKDVRKHWWPTHVVLCGGECDLYTVDAISFAKATLAIGSAVESATQTLPKAFVPNRSRMSGA